jgi:hypothetical protein
LQSKHRKLYYQPGIPVTIIYWSLTIGLILIGCIWEMESANFHWWAFALWIPGVLLAIYGILANTVTLSDAADELIFRRIFWLKPRTVRLVNVARVETTKITRTVQYKHPRYMRHEFIFLKKDRARFDEWTHAVRRIKRPDQAE